MKHKFPDSPEFQEALLDFHPKIIQTIIEHSNIEDIAICAQNFGEFENSYLYANLTKSELLELIYYIDRQQKDGVDSEVIKQAHARIKSKIQSVRKIVPNETKEEETYASYSFDEKISQLAEEPENPEFIIEFFIAASVLCRRVGFLGFEDYGDKLVNSGLEIYERCIDLIVEGTEPKTRSIAVRRICNAYSTVSKLLISEGIDSIQMGHNPVLLHGRMCCILRETSSSRG